MINSILNKLNINHNSASTNKALRWKAHMIFDENSDGQIIDSRYARDKLISRFKIVCESDVDNSSLPEQERHVINEFIEIGLHARTKDKAIEEVKKIICKFKSEKRKQQSNHDSAILLDRIFRLLSANQRAQETIIQEHLVGTGEDDPIVRNLEK